LQNSAPTTAAVAIKVFNIRPKSNARSVAIISGSLGRKPQLIDMNMKTNTDTNAAAAAFQQAAAR
jgi:hypothetical protein